MSAVARDTRAKGNAAFLPAAAPPVARLATWPRATARVVFVALPLVAWVGLVAGSHVYAPRLVDLIVSAGLAVAAWRLARPRSHETAVRGTLAWNEVAGACLLGFGCALAGFRALLTAGAVPAFRHDWAWPADATTMRELFTFLTADWTLRAFGEPKLYPSVAPIFAVLSPLASIFAPATLLALLLVACEVAAAAGAFVAARRWIGTSAAAAFAAAAAYACSPYVVDKVVAGHVHVLVAYAALPWLIVVLSALDRETSRRRIAAWTALAAALVGLSLAAITFLAFDALALAIVACVAMHRKRAAIAAAVALAGGALAHVQSFAHVERAWRAGTDLGPIGLDWLRQLSASSATVLSLFAYAPQYAAGGLPPLLRPNAAFALVPVALIAFGWAVVSHRRPLPAVGALGFAGVFATTGLDGPFAPLKAGLFEHVPALAAFREFYNAQLLVALALSLALAAAIDVARRSPALRIVAVSAVALIAVPFLSGTVSRDLLLWREPPAYAAFAAHLDKSDGSRVAMLPLLQPIRANGAPFAGTDVYFSGFAGHPTLAEWSAEPAVALGALAFQRGDVAGARRLFGALGVRYVVLRAGLASALPANWYGDLFPRHWEDGSAYASIASAPGWRHVASDAALTVLDDPAALPLVSLAGAPVPCAGLPLLALRAGRCANLAPAAAATGRFVSLDPNRVAIDPHVAWTLPRALFAQGYALAATAGGVATVGATPYAVDFDARPGERLFLRCVSRAGLRAYVNGTVAGTALCRGDLDASPRWAGPFATHDGRNRLVVQSGNGASLIDGLALTGSDLPPIDAFAWTHPFAAGFQRAHVSARRASATELGGTYDAPRPLWLVFSDAFDPGWTLSVDGAAPLASTRVDGVENGFAVPAGTHRFSLAYRASVLDRLLGDVQTAAWFAFATIALVALAGSRPRPAVLR